jgi:hypothetical protein
VEEGEAKDEDEDKAESKGGELEEEADRQGRALAPWPPGTRPGSEGTCSPAAPPTWKGGFYSVDETRQTLLQLKLLSRFSGISSNNPDPKTN